MKNNNKQNSKRIKKNKDNITPKVAATMELKWDKMYQELVTFRAAHPDKNPSSSSTNKDEQRLGRWWLIVKKLYREKKLNKQWAIKIEAIGIDVKKVNYKKSKETKDAEKLEVHYQNFLDFIEQKRNKSKINSMDTTLPIDEPAQQMQYKTELLLQLPSQHAKDKSERKLYYFLLKMKTLHKQHKLNDDWINRFDSIGFTLEKKTSEYTIRLEENWEPYYNDLVQFRKQHPNQWPNNYRRTGKEAKLFFWLKTLKNRQRKNQLKQEWIDKLQEIDYNFINEYRVDKEYFWKINIQKLIDFKQQNEGRFPRYKSIDESEGKLAAWLRNLKHANKINKLAIEKKQELEGLGFSFEKITTRTRYNLSADSRHPSNEKFYEKYNQLVEFLKTSPYRFPNRRDSDPLAKKLGIWLGNLKIAYKNNLLPLEWKEKMDAIGFSVVKLEYRKTGTHLQPYQYRKTGINVDLFYKTYNEFVEFRKQYPDKLPSVYKPISEQETHLANWVHWLRSVYKKNELPQDLIEKMQAVGCRLETGVTFQEKILLERWNKKTQELLAFKTTNVRWPVRKTLDKVESNLSRWMDDLKSKRVKEKIPNEWIEQLKEAGFSFTGSNSSNARTSKGYNKAKYAELVIFREQNPNKWPSRVFGIGVEKGLAIWLINQKTNYKKNKVDKDIFDKLKILGYNLAAGKKE